MPRLPTIRVIGSQAISTRPLLSPVLVFGAICVQRPSSSRRASRLRGVRRRASRLRAGGGNVLRVELPAPAGHRGARHQGGRYPVVSLSPVCRHFGSLSTVLAVIDRSLRITAPYAPLAVLDTLPP